MHEPCGTPVSIACRLSLFPSRQIAAHLPCRKEWTHFAMGRGSQYAWIVLRRCECRIESKKPVISKVNIEALHLCFQADSMSCTVQIRASSADLLVILPYCY